MAGPASHRIVIAFTCALALAGLLCASPQQAQDIERERRRMVEEQIQSRGVRNTRVLEAMRTVPRHEFVADAYKSAAYSDTPLPTSQGQTISQPYIVALMTELADPKPEHRVLEVGTGSGYQAAILSGLVREVYSIELVAELAASAKQRLDRLGFKNVQVRQGDGYLGWPQAAPFDSILVTAGATEVPQPLVSQLKPGGRMIIPVGGSSLDQVLKVVEMWSAMARLSVLSTVQRQLYEVLVEPLDPRSNRHMLADTLDSRQSSCSVTPLERGSAASFGALPAEALALRSARNLSKRGTSGVMSFSVLSIMLEY